MSSRFTINDLALLEARGMKVNLSAPMSKNREVTVIDGGKVETLKIRKEMSHEESELQQNCVKAFRLMYPRMKMRLFSIPNGSYRNSTEASILSAEGCMKGVSDLFLAVPVGKYSGAFIELKTASGRLSEYQVQFIKEYQEDYYCCVIRSVEEFLKEVKEYLKS